MLVQSCIGLYFYVLNLYRGKYFFCKKYWLYALNFNLPLIPHYLSQSVLNQSDRIMINSMVGMGEAAIYSVAYSISTLMVLVTSAINSSFIPYTYKCIRDKKYTELGNITKQYGLFLQLLFQFISCSYIPFLVTLSFTLKQIIL